MNPDENKNILANRAIERLISINENRFVKTLLIPNIAGKMPIEIIVEKNMISLLRYIFNTAVVEGKVSFQNFKDLFSRTSTQGETLLLLAIRLESTQMLKEILVCAEKFGWGNEKIVGINTVNFDGNTALHLAFLKNNYLLANQLIAFGASCLKENNNNQFPLDILLEKSNDYTLLNFLMQESCLLLDEYAIERFIDTYKRNIDDIKKISMFTALALQKLFNKLNDQLTSSSLKTRQTATFTLLHTLTATKFALKMNQDPDKKVLVLNNCESQTRRSKFFRNIVKPLTILLAILTCTIAGAVVGAALGAIVSGGLGTVPGALLGLFAGALAAPAIVGGCLSSIAITSGCLWYQYRSKDKAVADVIHAANDDLIFFKSNYRKSLMP